MDRIVGIDISKQDFVIAILTDNKPMIKKFDYGFNKLIKYFRTSKIDNDKICMEATGNMVEN
jgi:hypothetical protein